MPAKPGHRYAPQYRRATAVLLTQRLPGLDTDGAMQALRRARGWHSYALYELHDHLEEHPDALATGNSACSASLIRLVHILLADGRDDVVAPACVSCGRTTLQKQHSQRQRSLNAARLAVVALILWVVIDLIRTTLAVGHYEHRITGMTHGHADVWFAWMAYGLLDFLLPLGMATAVADRMWILGTLVAAAAFGRWLYQARRNAGRSGGSLKWAPGWAVGGWFIPVANLMIPYLVLRDVRRASAPASRSAPVGWWWTSVLVTVLLNRLIWLLGVVTSDGGSFHGTALDTRTMAYPLWAAGTVMIVVTAFLSARVMRRISEAQQRTGDAGATGPE